MDKLAAISHLPDPRRSREGTMAIHIQLERATRRNNEPLKENERVVAVGCSGLRDDHPFVQKSKMLLPSALSPFLKRNDKGNTGFGMGYVTFED